jgi:transmembrane sensor
MTRRDDKPPVWDEDRLWAALRARTVDATPDPASRPPRASRLRRIAQFENDGVAKYAAAAILVILLGAGALVVRMRQHAAPPAVAEREPVHYSTSRGQFATIRLTDSSQVTLAPESRLTIPASFAQGERVIALDGEAIFTVHHDAEHPFRVRANGALIQDIGTRFDLRAYRNEPAVTVAVAEGAVALGRDRDGTGAARFASAEGVVLHRGDIGSLNKQGEVSSKRSARVASVLAWADGRLYFVNRPLPEVLLSIGRWHDLDVRVPDARLAARLVTAEFSTQSPSEMIDALAIAVDATVERSGRVVTLRPK